MWKLLDEYPFLTGKDVSRNVIGTDQYRCIVKLADGQTCKRVELTYAKMVLHLAVEHGITRRVHGN